MDVVLRDDVAHDGVGVRDCEPWPERALQLAQRQLHPFLRLRHRRCHIVQQHGAHHRRVIATEAPADLEEHRIARLQLAALPCRVADHGARAAGHIRHHSWVLAARCEHAAGDLGGDVVLRRTDFRRGDSGAHPRLGRSGRLAHDVDLGGGLAHAPLLDDAEAVHQLPRAVRGVDAVLEIGGEEVAVALVADVLVGKPEFSQRRDQLLDRVTGVGVGARQLHPRAFDDIRTPPFVSDHERFGTRAAPRAPGRTSTPSSGSR